jgi:ATP-dependent DNA ligase
MHGFCSSRSFVDLDLTFVRDIRANTLRSVLDGELVADADKAEDFYRLGPNLRASSRRDTTFFAFDLLVLDNDNLCDRP